MVQGLDKLRKYLSGYEDAYILIGGVATELNLEAVDLGARATKDIDLILCVEALNDDVFVALLKLIDDAGYEVRERGEAGAVFYRFSSPLDAGFPSMIELFSRVAVEHYDTEFPGGYLTPIPGPAAGDSLSAIVLSDGYYDFALANTTILEGVRVLTPGALIPFKARAWLDLTARRNAGEHVDSKDIKKHRGDICRLSQMISRDARVALPQGIRGDVSKFIVAALSDGPEPDAYRVPGMTLVELAEFLRSVYQIAVPGGSVSTMVHSQCSES